MVKQDLKEQLVGGASTKLDAVEGPRDILDHIQCDSTVVWTAKDWGAETGGIVF